MKIETFTTKQISEILGITINVVYKKIERLKIPYIHKKGNAKYFDIDLFIDKRKEIVVHSLLKTTETFYIYPSKINNQ